MTTDQEPQATEQATEREIHTSDPERIQALAHPLRLALIDVIQDLGEATASECAERLGQTVANCSFHLRVLEKAGFIERAEPRGREKPWRSASARRVLEPDPQSPASFLAVSELITATMTHISGRLARYIREDSRTDDPRWRDATGLNQETLWLTVEEARDLVSELRALTAPLHGRAHDPAKRPPGARLVRLATLIHPEAPETTEQ